MRCSLIRITWWEPSVFIMCPSPSALGQVTRRRHRRRLDIAPQFWHQAYVIEHIRLEVFRDHRLYLEFLGEPYVSISDNYALTICYIDSVPHVDNILNASSLLSKLINN